MIVSQTFDKSEAMEVLNHPEIRECISDDNTPDDAEIGDGIYIIGKVDKKPVALMHYHFEDKWICHVQVIPEYRDQAMEFGKKSLDWFFHRFDDDLYAVIPTKYPNVMRFAEKHGFEKIGETEGTYLKNGKNYDDITYRLKKWAHLET